MTDIPNNKAPVELRFYEMAIVNDLTAWLCRRCLTVHIDAVQEADTESGWTQRGLTLADMVESAGEHEQQDHP